MQSSERPSPASTPVAQVPSPAAELAAAEPSDPTAEGTEHIHLPPPTIWPVVTAFGVAFAGLGLVSNLMLSIAGLLIMVYGLASWVQELRHEPH
jgi:hypothetical protein